MVIYLVDTDVLIDFLNGRKTAIDVIKSFDISTFAISIITLAEVLEGLVDDPPKFTSVKKGLSTFTNFSINEDIAEVFAYQRFKLRKRGTLIDNMDLLIAATALVYNLTLITKNKKHFQKIEELQLFKDI